VFYGDPDPSLEEDCIYDDGSEFPLYDDYSPRPTMSSRIRSTVGAVGSLCGGAFFQQQDAPEFMSPTNTTNAIINNNSNNNSPTMVHGGNLSEDRATTNTTPATTTDRDFSAFLTPMTSMKFSKSTNKKDGSIDDDDFSEFHTPMSSLSTVKSNKSTIKSSKSAITNNKVPPPPKMNGTENDVLTPMAGPNVKLSKHKNKFDRNTSKPPTNKPQHVFRNTLKTAPNKAESKPYIFPRPRRDARVRNYRPNARGLVGHDPEYNRFLAEAMQENLRFLPAMPEKTSQRHTGTTNIKRASILKGNAAVSPASQKNKGYMLPKKTDVRSHFPKCSLTVLIGSRSVPSGTAQALEANNMYSGTTESGLPPKVSLTAQMGIQSVPSRPAQATKAKAMSSRKTEKSQFPPKTFLTTEEGSRAEPFPCSLVASSSKQDQSKAANNSMSSDKDRRDDHRYKDADSKNINKEATGDKSSHNDDDEASHGKSSCCCNENEKLSAELPEKEIAAKVKGLALSSPVVNVRPVLPQMAAKGEAPDEDNSMSGMRSTISDNHSSESSVDTDTDEDEVREAHNRIFGITAVPATSNCPTSGAQSVASDSGSESSIDTDTDDDEVRDAHNRIFGIVTLVPASNNSTTEAQSALPGGDSDSNSSYDTDTDDEEVREAHNRIFGIVTAPSAQNISLHEDQSTMVDSESTSNSSYDTDTDEEEVRQAHNRIFGINFVAAAPAPDGKEEAPLLYAKKVALVSDTTENADQVASDSILDTTKEAQSIVPEVKDESLAPSSPTWNMYKDGNLITSEPFPSAIKKDTTLIRDGKDQNLVMFAPVSKPALDMTKEEEVPLAHDNGDEEEKLVISPLKSVTKEGALVVRNDDEGTILDTPSDDEFGPAIDDGYEATESVEVDNDATKDIVEDDITQGQVVLEAQSTDNSAIVRPNTYASLVAAKTALMEIRKKRGNPVQSSETPVTTVRLTGQQIERVWTQLAICESKEESKDESKRSKETPKKKTATPPKNAVVRSQSLGSLDMSALFMGSTVSFNRKKKKEKNGLPKRSNSFSGVGRKKFRRDMAKRKRLLNYVGAKEIKPEDLASVAGCRVVKGDARTCGVDAVTVIRSSAEHGGKHVSVEEMRLFRAQIKREVREVQRKNGEKVSSDPSVSTLVDYLKSKGYSVKGLPPGFSGNAKQILELTSARILLPLGLIYPKFEGKSVGHILPFINGTLVDNEEGGKYMVLLTSTEMWSSLIHTCFCSSIPVNPLLIEPDVDLVSQNSAYEVLAKYMTTEHGTPKVIVNTAYIVETKQEVEAGEIAMKEPRRSALETKLLGGVRVSTINQCNLADVRERQNTLQILLAGKYENICEDETIEASWKNVLKKTSGSYLCLVSTSGYPKGICAVLYEKSKLISESKIVFPQGQVKEKTALAYFQEVLQPADGSRITFERLELLATYKLAAGNDVLATAETKHCYNVSSTLLLLLAQLKIEKPQNFERSLQHEECIDESEHIKSIANAAADCLQSVGLMVTLDMEPGKMVKFLKDSTGDSMVAVEAKLGSKGEVALVTRCFIHRAATKQLLSARKIQKFNGFTKKSASKAITEALFTDAEKPMAAILKLAFVLKIAATNY